MRKLWKDWLALNAVELQFTALVIGCVVITGMFMRWSG